MMTSHFQLAGCLEQLMLVEARGQQCTNISPGGELFANKATAFKFMMKDNYNEDATSNMKAGLLKDDW